MYSIYESTPLLAYCCLMAGLFGAAMGSFLNCAAWRIAHGESFLVERSRCPACGHVLAPLDLVPVLSYIFLRGRCRYCGTRISPRYALTECLFAGVSVLCLLRFDATPLCLRNYIFLCCLFCLSLVDLDTFLIPDGCLILPALAWALTAPLLPLRDIGFSLLSALLYAGGMLALSLIMDTLLKKESLGGGDIKLFAVMGLYLGPLVSLFALMLSCVLGLLFAFATRQGSGNPFPFGPAISAASAVMLFCGEPLTKWYMGFF